MSAMGIEAIGVYIPATGTDSHAKATRRRQNSRA